jgi:antitoxin component of RelBE/YafQ-DinJ toxin-antitoxin module
VTQQKYYLVSLNESEFHQFSPTILQAIMQENIVPISELLHKTIFELTKSKVTFDVLLQQVIRKHGIELEQFYSKPLNTNKKFLDAVYEEYENANISHETGGNINSLIELLKHNDAFFKRLNTHKEDQAPQDDELGDVPKI